MRTLKLENFKAFSQSSEVDFEDKNALIYGENGSGKSSVFDALKLWFYTQKIFSPTIDRLTEPSEIANAKNDILDSYNNQTDKLRRFNLFLNGAAYNAATTPSGFNTCLICRDDIICTDTLNVNDILANSFVGISDPISFITPRQQADIEVLINATLNYAFT